MMFKWWRRKAIKREFEINLRVYLYNQRGGKDLNFASDFIKNLNNSKDYKSTINQLEEINRVDLIPSQTFIIICSYFGDYALYNIELEEGFCFFEQRIKKLDFDNLEMVFHMMFNLLAVGVMRLQEGEISDDAFSTGRNKIIDFFGLLDVPSGFVLLLNTGFGRFILVRFQDGGQRHGRAGGVRVGAWFERPLEGFWPTAGHREASA